MSHASKLFESHTDGVNTPGVLQLVNTAVGKLMSVHQRNQFLAHDSQAHQICIHVCIMCLQSINQPGFFFESTKE